MTYRILLALALLLAFQSAHTATPIKIGLNYPESGRYKDLALQQRLAAFLAVEEINARGGVLGRPLEIVTRNTRLKSDQAAKNVIDMIDNDDVQMIFGGVSSPGAIASGKAAKQRDRLFFGTTTYANETTGKAGHTHVFRESYNAWMTANALGQYLAREFRDKRFFYITADYSWGYSVEESLRAKSGTNDTNAHPVARTPFPNAHIKDFREALEKAQASKAEVLVLVLGGDDMARAMRLANEMGLKEKMQFVWPNTSLATALKAGPALMQGIIGTAPWFWNLPYEKGYQPGIDFVEKFTKTYGMRPSSVAASAYSIVYQYGDAVERAGTTNTAAVIRALEGHRYSLLKDTQEWRAFDHQNVQSVYVVRMKSRDQVLQDEYHSDFYEILDSIDGTEAARTLAEWQATRRAAGVPLTLQ